MAQNKTKQYILTGVFLGMGIILPTFFHYAGINGRIFLPMHIPVLIAGYFISPYLSLVLGVLTPLMNSIFTGMPVLFPMALIMAIEIGVYGLTTALLSQKIKLNKMLTLFSSMVAGRIAAGIMVFVLASSFGVKLKPLIFIKGAIIIGLPGIIIQLIIIPIIVTALEKNMKTKGISA